MARDSSGTFTSISNSWNAAVEGTTIDEADWNEWRADVETELTDSLSRSGKGKVSAHVDFDENGSPGTPASNVGRLYAGDVGGITSLFYKDSAGTTHDLTLPGDGVPYTFASTTTTTSDPGANKIAFNNATFASVTEIAIDDLDAYGADISAWIATWDDEGTSNRGNLIIRNRANGGDVAIFRISGANTDETGWTRLAVTPITQAGAFSDLDPLFVHYGSPGATGPVGPAGDAGVAGADGASNIFVQASEPAGNDGDLWIDTDDGALYKKISGTWTSQSYSVVGPAGPAGPTGPAGADGAVGPAGADGAVGPAGPAGPTGPAGADGAGAVDSVFGRTGAIVAANSDYDMTQIDFSAADRIAGRVTAGAGLAEELTAAQVRSILNIADGTNLLINGDFNINQRSFAGGALTAGVYGFDRWKAATGDANLSLSGYVVTLTSGAIEQVVEPGAWGVTSFASTALTISVDTPSKDLGISFGSQSGTITAGSGRRSVTFTMGAGDTGNLTLQIDRSADDVVTFGRVKLEIGSIATPWLSRPLTSEFLLCARYFSKINIPYSVRGNGGYRQAFHTWNTPMRVAPTLAGTINQADATDGTITSYVQGVRFQANLGASSTARYGYETGWTADSEL